MSLAVAQEMLARLEADGLGLLQTWADSQGQGPARPMLGWPKPTGAGDWPYLGLVPTRRRLDLRRDEVSEAAVSLSGGIRLPVVERPAAEGIVAVEALITAALDTLAAPLSYSAGGCVLVLTTAEHVDAELRHPLYELEVLLTLYAPGS